MYTRKSVGIPVSAFSECLFFDLSATQKNIHYAELTKIYFVVDGYAQLDANTFCKQMLI